MFLAEPGPAIHEDHTEQESQENNEDHNTDNQESLVGLDDAGLLLLPNQLDLDVQLPSQSPLAPDFASNLAGPSATVSRLGTFH